MASLVDFALVTPGAVKFEGRAEIVVMPGAAGDFGALPQHAPMLTTLRIGVLRATVEGAGRIEYAVRGGFAQVLPDKVVVLTDVALAQADIDVDAARADLRRAEEDGASREGDGEEAQRDAIAWANARLAAAHRQGY